MTYQIRLFIGFVITWATRRVSHVEQNLHTIPKNLSSSQFLVEFVLLSGTTNCLFVFLFISHGVVSLFSIYEFDCPSGIFRPSFILLPIASFQYILHELIKVKSAALRYYPDLIIVSIILCFCNPSPLSTHTHTTLTKLSIYRKEKNGNEKSHSLKCVRFWIYIFLLVTFRGL